MHTCVCVSRSLPVSLSLMIDTFQKKGATFAECNIISPSGKSDTWNIKGQRSDSNQTRHVCNKKKTNEKESSADSI